VQVKVTIKNESADFGSASSPSLPSLASVEDPSPKLTKTERKGRGPKKSNVVHQQLTKIKADRPVNFLSPASAQTLLALLRFASFVGFLWQIVNR
jgi:hypothetical protein